MRWTIGVIGLLFFLLLGLASGYGASLEELDDHVEGSDVLEGVTLSNLSVQVEEDKLGYTMEVANQRPLSRKAYLQVRIGYINANATMKEVTEQIFLSEHERTMFEGSLNHSLCNTSYRFEAKVRGDSGIPLDTIGKRLKGSDNQCVIFDPGLRVSSEGQVNYSREDIDKGTSLMLPAPFYPATQPLHLEFGLNSSGTVTEGFTIHVDLTSHGEGLSLWHIEEHVEKLQGSRLYRFPARFGYEGTYAVRASLHRDGKLLGASERLVTLVNQSRPVSLLRTYTPSDRLIKEEPLRVYVLTAAKEKTNVEVRFKLRHHNETVQSFTRSIQVPQGVHKSELDITPNHSLESFNLRCVIVPEDGQLTIEHRVGSPGILPPNDSSQQYSASLDYREGRLTEGCFNDGRCTPQEREFGGCSDCGEETLLEKNLNKRNSGVWIIGGVALLLGSGYIMYRRSRNKDQSANGM